MPASQAFWAKQRELCECGHQFQEHWNDKRVGHECAKCECQKFIAAPKRVVTTVGED